jgi:ankyrin repeat protein
LLLQAGANARQAATTGVFLGKTPLMWASSQGRTEVVRMLLLAGVDVNHSSHVGNFKVIKKILFLVLRVFLYLFNSTERSFVMIFPC